MRCWNKPLTQIGALAILFNSYVADAVEFSLYGDSSVQKSKNTQQFNLGGLNLTAEQEVSDTSHVIAEILFEFANHGYEANVTRLAITKNLTPSTEVYAGKFVKGLGLWHQNFHHGSLALDTISLPFFIGGLNEHHSFSTAHIVGAGLRSRLGKFSYQLALGNHPGIDTTASTVGDMKISQLDRRSPAKDFSSFVKFNYSFNWKSEISLLAERRDVIELGSKTSGGSGSYSGLDEGEALFKQDQVGINFLYSGQNFQSFFEYYVLTTKDNPSISTSNNPVQPFPVTQQNRYDATMYYLQLGWKFTDSISSSIRYEALEYTDNNTFFQVLGLDKQSGYIWGINYRFDESNALRFEAKHLDAEEIFVGKAVRPDDTVYSMQWFFLLL